MKTPIPNQAVKESVSDGRSNRWRETIFRGICSGRLLSVLLEGEIGILL